RLMLTRYRSRAALGLALMASQALFYNAIFFTYALVLAKFYGVPEQSVGYYIFPFALGNFLGPLLLGRLFDSIGRRQMIAALYGAIIETGSRDALFAAYAFAGLLMCGAAAVALWLGIDAERKPLEEVCAPLGCDPLRT